MKSDLKHHKVLFSADIINTRVKALGKKISRDLAESGNTVILAVADGGLVFAADLARKIKLPLYFDQIAVASYKGTVSSGKITLRTEPRLELTGRNILLVDDILDSGLTISFLTEYLKQFKPKQILTCVVLDKPSGRKIPFQADYVGFEAPDHFVIGYGMDFNGLYRNLPYIGCLDETNSSMIAMEESTV